MSFGQMTAAKDEVPVGGGAPGGAAANWANPWAWAAQAAALAGGVAGGGGADAAALFGHYAGDPKGAGAALDRLTSLPPAVQGAAIDQMTDAQFHDLLTSVPPDQRERFATLFQSAGNDERKLELWGEYYKSKSANDSEGLKAKILADASLSEAEKQTRLDKLAAIEASTGAEADEEVAHGLAELQDWEHPSEEMGSCRAPGARPPLSVEEIAERKDHEHDIEMKHLVNLTNTTYGHDDEGMPTRRAVWSDEELWQIDSALGRLPDEATAGNEHIKEIRREREDWDPVDGKWKPSPTTGGEHGEDGVITVTDAGVDGGNRLNGETSDIAGHYAGQPTPMGPVTSLEETIDHEIGHAVADANPDAYAHMMAAAGWNAGLSGDDVEARMVAAGMSKADAEAQVDAMDAARGAHYTERPETDAGGQLYSVNPYGPGFQSQMTGAIPTSGADPNQDDWGYARTNPADHFAEMYTKAVHVPESLYEDMVGKPKAAMAKVTSEMADQEKELARLRKSGADAATIASAEAAVTQSRTTLARVQQLATARAEERRIMREEVFGVTDESVDDAYASMVKGAGKAHKKEARALEAQFRAEADKAMTPQQLADLTARYQAKL